jgi:hypothetical protein
VERKEAHHELQPATAILILTASETLEHEQDDSALDGFDSMSTIACRRGILVRIAAALRGCQLCSIRDGLWLEEATCSVTIITM